MMPDDGAISVRAAREDDLPWLTELENRPENAAFVHQWTHDTHADWISRRGIRYLIAELDGHRAGYAILNGVSGSDASIELKRIVVEKPGHGVGAAMLADISQYAFGELGAANIWLDVYEHNERAQQAYRRAGFVETERRSEAGTGGDDRALVIMTLHPGDARNNA